jgi:hypothetical protein
VKSSLSITTSDKGNVFLQTTYSKRVTDMMKKYKKWVINMQLVFWHSAIKNIPRIKDMVKVAGLSQILFAVGSTYFPIAPRAAGVLFYGCVLISD